MRILEKNKELFHGSEEANNFLIMTTGKRNFQKRQNAKNAKKVKPSPNIYSYAYYILTSTSTYCNRSYLMESVKSEQCSQNKTHYFS